MQAHSAPSSGGMPPPGARPMPPMPPGVPPLRPGVPPTPEQLAVIRQFQQQMNQRIAHEAGKAGVSVPEFVQRMKQQQEATRQQMQHRQQQQEAAGGNPGQGQGQGQGQPQQGHQGQEMQPRPTGQPQTIQPGPPNPIAIALANFLRSQELKPRTCILNGERKDMFRVKRALRALQSPAYETARKKNPALPVITDRPSLENTFKLLPMSMLAIRVEKAEAHADHDHPPKRTKRVKGLWTVQIVGQQDAGDDMYYAWMYEGSQVMRKVYAALALVAIFVVVCYPLWPLKMRQGVYYLSWAFLSLLGVFFLMAIFRVILFCVTYFLASPGLWLFPNLWEDVSFVQSFIPVWAWHETVKKKKKSKSSGGAGINPEASSTFAAATGQPMPASARTTATDTQIATGDSKPHQRSYVSPRVEEIGDDE